jgi:hypothetical protein
VASILEIILKTIRQGTGIPDTQKELTGLQNVIANVKTAFGALGVFLSAQQGIEIAQELADTAREANSAKAALTAAAEGAATYEEAMSAATAVTQGMVSQQQLASGLATIFGAGLAQNAQQAAELANAGAILGKVFESAGASQDLYVRLLSSGSIQLFNNFGITAAMVAEKQKEIEATSKLTGEEARLAAVKATLIENAKKYQNALTEDARAAAQFEASLTDAKAALGQFILPEITDGMQNLGTALRGITDALDSMTPSARGAVDALIDLTNPISALNGLIDDYQALTGQATAATNEVTTATQEATAATKAAAPIYGVQIDAVHRLAAEQRRLAAEIDNAAQAQANANLRSAKEAAPELGARITENRAAVYQMQQDKEEAEQRTDERAARSMTSAFTKAADDIGNIIGGKLQTTFQDVFKLPESGTENADEPARRLATVAAAGFGSEWLTQLNQQFSGAAFWQPMAQAMAAGDEGQLKAAATTALQQFQQGLITDLWNVEQIRNQVRSEFQAKRIREQLIEEVKAQLGTEGVSQAIGVVEVAAGNVGVATAQTETSVSTMAATATTAANQMATDFNAAVAPVDILLLRIRELNNLLRETINLAKGAAGGIGGLNPPNAPGTGPGGTPNSAANKMGGETPL